MKTYRGHYCERVHTSYRTMAKCIWSRAAWVNGNGPYATIAKCRVVTVQLHQTLRRAQLAILAMNATGCGGACPCTGHGHELIRLELPSESVRA